MIRPDLSGEAIRMGRRLVELLPDEPETIMGITAMERYVGGFVIPLPENRVDQYKNIAEKAGALWKEHGALEYWES